MNRILTFLLLFSLVSCIPSYMERKRTWTDSQKTKDAVIVKRDNYQKATKYIGPNCAPNACDNLFIRAWKRDNRADITYQIYVTECYSGEHWRFYSHAYDSDGNKLDFTSIDKQVRNCGKYGCSYSEHIGLNVDEAYLEKSRKGGINIKLIGKAGEEVIFIPGQYVSGFLDALPKQ